MTDKNSPARASRGRNAPQTAARRLIGHDWTTAAHYADLIADSLTDAQAEHCYGRLARAGGKKCDDPTERIRIGRERLAQEALQRLVQRGELEAAGTGSDRMYRRKDSPGDGFMHTPRPKFRKEAVSFERLTFDLRLQMRHIATDTGEVALFDEAWVKHLLELRQDKVELEPLEAVEEKIKGKQPILWVFRGFHRGEARKRNGENSVEVLIYPGTFADAQFYALSENGKQPKPRTPDDCQRAFDTMLDTPELLRRVMESAKDQGGVHRSMAAACGLSHGAVGKYLERRGIQVDRKTGKIVEIPKPEIVSPPPPPPPPPPPEPNLARAGENEADEQEEKEPAEPRTTPPVQASVSVSVSDVDPILAGAKDILADVATKLRSVGRSVESLLRSKVGDTLRDKARLAGTPFEVVTRTIEKQIPHEIVKEEIVTWPAFATLQAVFSQVSAVIAEQEAAQGKWGK